MSWLKELIDPIVKCKRLGHNNQAMTRKTIRWPSESPYRGVADDCREKKIECRRCGEILVNWEVTDRTTIDSLSMDSDRWDKLKECGVILC